MKTTANLRSALFGVLGVVLCLTQAISAAERSADANAHNHGTAALSGQLSGTICNEVIYGAGETVTLTPLSTSGPGGRALSVKTDGDGRFVFQDLPPGEYEVKAQISWTTSYIEVYDDGTRDRMYADHSKPLVARVQVKPGQKARLTAYSEGSAHDAFYAYGGVLSKPHHALVRCQ